MFKDKTGMAVGEEVYASAKEGEVSEISYKWLQPGGGDQQVDKVSFYTKVADQVCGGRFLSAVIRCCNGCFRR